MELIYSSQQPVKVELMGARRRLNYNVRELSESEIKELWNKEENVETPYEYFASEHRYAYNSLVMGSGQWNYGGIVNAIIRDKYQSDEMEAITNNMNVIVSEFFEYLVAEGILRATKYLLESVNGEKSKTFEEMQNWRAMAKGEARLVLNME